MAPALIHEEGHLVLRAVRDLYDKDVERIIVEGDDAYNEARTFVKMLMPSHTRKVVHHEDNGPLFVMTGVEDQLEGIYSPTVQLPSGGYIVINQTEALVAIDVNSGKATRERNVEATALKTNMEAAAEACRQMRLRDLAGLIVIDFIDMEDRQEQPRRREEDEGLPEDRPGPRADGPHLAVRPVRNLPPAPSRRRAGTVVGALRPLRRHRPHALDRERRDPAAAHDRSSRRR